MVPDVFVCIFPSEITSDMTSDFLSSFWWHVGRFLLHVRRFCMSDVFSFNFVGHCLTCRTFFAHFVRQRPTRPTKGWNVHPHFKQKNSLAVRHGATKISIAPTQTFSFYKNNAYKNMRLRFGPNFWSIFLNTIDIQHRITQKESTHSIFILSLYLIGRVGWKVEKVEKKVCNTDENPYSIIKWSKLTHS